MKFNLLFLLLLISSFFSCKPSRQRGKIGQSAMVVSAHPLASEIGTRILRQGGNAIDASVAVQFALAVVYPVAGNIGGGGFMLLRFANGKYFALDYREKAPEAAYTDMYINELGEPDIMKSREGHLSCGVPGSVAGMFEAHDKFGQLKWADLVQPAIDLATIGFPLTKKEAASLRKHQDRLKQNNTIYPENFIRDNWTEGDTIYHPDLAVTLTRIRDRGTSGFYEGETAEAIVAEMQRGRGIMTYDDLKNYKPVWRLPITCNYRGYKIVSMPPPSSGGVALVQLLKSIEPYSISQWQHNTAKTLHLLIEAERRVYADRANYLGDPDFFPVPVKQLTDSVYIAQRMSTFRSDTVTSSILAFNDTTYRLESEQTTHLSIVDEQGNAVSVTTTLNGGYGSHVVVGGAGFLLNNEMDDFSIKPGTPNMYGAVGGSANKIVPQKRMLSSMTPTIVEKTNDLFMVLGTPGGTTIITSVFQVLQNVIDHQMTMQEAVSAKRVHSQCLPDSVYSEPGAITKQDSVILAQWGHNITIRESIGRVDAILCLPDGQLEGGADPRGDDTASGY